MKKVFYFLLKIIYDDSTLQQKKHVYYSCITSKFKSKYIFIYVILKEMEHDNSIIWVGSIIGYQISFNFVHLKQKTKIILPPFIGKSINISLPVFDFFSCCFIVNAFKKASCL